jgi:hypothetical protein
LGAGRGSLGSLTTRRPLISGMLSADVLLYAWANWGILSAHKAVLARKVLTAFASNRSAPRDTSARDTSNGVSSTLTRGASFDFLYTREPNLAWREVAPGLTLKLLL